MIAPLLLGVALAAEGPSVWVRQSLAVAGWPSGALSNTIAEARVPLHRSESVLFQSTYAGLGAQVMVSPAFVTVGPRLSLAPVDVFDLNLKAAHGWYFGNGLGLMPFDTLGGTLESDRDARRDEAIGSRMWVFSAEPTLKAKLGPLVAFDAWTVDVLRIERPAGVDAPYTYEPYRDLVVAWDDVALEHHAGLLYEVLPGGERPMLRLGPTFRDRFTTTSKDRSAALGLLVAAKPAPHPAVPTLVGFATWYILDEDREGPIPFLAAQARWELDLPLGDAP